MLNDNTTTPRAYDFADARVGDVVTFLTRDNGFGGSGDMIQRQGTITNATDKSITVQAGHSTLRRETNVARINRRDWYDRSVRLVSRLDRLPYTAEHALIVDKGGIVTVLWTPDPELARRPEQINLLDQSIEVEVVATMTRFTKRDGADFSGWVINRGGSYSDPIRTKAAAMRDLREVIADYFPKG